MQWQHNKQASDLGAVARLPGARSRADGGGCDDDDDAAAEVEGPSGVHLGISAAAHNKTVTLNNWAGSKFNLESAKDLDSRIHFFFLFFCYTFLKGC